MNRILIFGMGSFPGGVENFLANYYREIDREKVQFDFLSNAPTKIAYEDELVALGARVFHITSRRQNPLKYKQQVMDVFRTHGSEWSALWVNLNILANIDYLKIAKKVGINKRIIHSHNSHSMDRKMNYRLILHNLNKHVIGRYATDFWACSKGAAKWFYTGKALEKAVVIQNAINIDRTAFDPFKRDAIRKAQNWDNKYVIGNVGRLHFQKNQSFTIDIFNHYHIDHPNSILAFVGAGRDTQMLKQKVQSLGLSDAVVFVGVQHDIQAWLSSFDLFLFPSRFEGLGIAALEAQANGVPVLASKGVIPDEVKINENFVFFDLDRGAEAWSKKIEEMSCMEREAFDVIKPRFQEKGFDIQKEAEKLEKMLIE